MALMTRVGVWMCAEHITRLMVMMMLFPFAHMAQQTINEGGFFRTGVCAGTASNERGQHACDA
jgi:hypothetical protein